MTTILKAPTVEEAVQHIKEQEEERKRKETEHIERAIMYAEDLIDNYDIMNREITGTDLSHLIEILKGDN